jgi:hypothetical protein
LAIGDKLMPRTPVSIEVVEDAEVRFVITTFSDGTVDRKAVDPNQKRRRRPRRPIAKATIVDRTRRKRF